MEIENNKEEVPFSYYEGLFRNLDPQEAAERLGVQWDGKEFTVKLLGRRYAISHPEYAIRELTIDNEQWTIRGSEGSAACGGRSDLSEWQRSVNDAGVRAKESTGHRNRRMDSSDAEHPQNDTVRLGLSTQTFLLRYLLEGKKVAATGNWLTFREMPWGELYIKPYTGRVLTRAAFTFGTRVDAFKAAAEKMGALPVGHGDAGYQFELVDGYDLQILVWAGDEEFPPNAQVLYSDNFAAGFAAEDRVVAGDILISAIKGNM